ncbi:MAG: aminotransferase class III-fold pyridoxal phosphate-dependent enzyme, partial [Flavisolibacter sp.]|nr:aminotransferase class III-fold pyridoxal phosphate-dependent enzyme [Flavisolibacter sp.]
DEKAFSLGNFFRSEIEKLDSPHIKMIRGKGLLNAIEIQHSDKDAAQQLCLLMKEEGLLAKPTHGDKIRLAPPLVITKEQLAECIAIINHALQELDSR